MNYFLFVAINYFSVPIENSIAQLQIQLFNNENKCDDVKINEKVIKNFIFRF